MQPLPRAVSCASVAGRTELENVNSSLSWRCSHTRTSSYRTRAFRIIAYIVQSGNSLEKFEQELAAHETLITSEAHHGPSSATQSLAAFKTGQATDTWIALATLF